MSGRPPTPNSKTSSYELRRQLELSQIENDRCASGPQDCGDKNNGTVVFCDQFNILTSTARLEEHSIV